MNWTRRAHHPEHRQGVVVREVGGHLSAPGSKGSDVADADPQPHEVPAPTQTCRYRRLSSPAALSARTL